MDLKKIDADTVEITSKGTMKRQLIERGKADLTAKIAELQAKLADVDEMLGVLNATAK